MPFHFYLPSLEDMRATHDGLEMLRTIDDDNFKSALISGCPGSGKTTVSIQRLVRLNNQGVSVRLVTYQNMLVLAIQNLANVRHVSEQRVSTFHMWYCSLTDSRFDTDAPPTPQDIIDALDSTNLATNGETELLIDEGQDLPPCVYDALPHYFDRVFVGADNAQQVHHGHGARMEQIEQSLRDNFPPYRRFPLGRNFRNTYETYMFSRQFIHRANLVAWDPVIPQRLLAAERRGPKPTVVSYRNDAFRNEHLKTTLANADGNVAILCPLGALPQSNGHSGESVDEMHELITGMGIPATKYHNKVPVPNSLERYVVTTFISAKGMEFDVVIIPRINFFKHISEEWYVACTRARRQLFVYRDLAAPQRDPIAPLDTNTYDAESADAPPAPPVTVEPF